MQNLKVVILSNFDYAGSGYKIAQAVMRVSPDIKVDCFTGHRPRYNYKTGTVITKDNYKEIEKIVADADIIHFKGDDLPEDYFKGIKIPNKPKVITIGGSGFRRHGPANIARARFPIEEYIKRTHVRTVNTPDLNYPELDGIYTPLPIDSLSIVPKYNPGACPLCGHKTPLIISHSPSSRAKKGTDSVILPAMDKLRRRDVKFEFDLIYNVPFSECVGRKKDSTIFIDNISEMGFFCNSGLEAMQYGVPVICSISQQAINQSQGLCNNLPVIVCHNKDDIYLAIKQLFANIPRLKELSQKSKAYADKYHSYEAVGKMWKEIYSKL